MDLKKIGRLIIKKRKELNYTQEKLSELLDCTPQAISLWETGQRFPDPEAQIRIHEVLGLNPVELLTGLPMFDDELKKGIDRYMRRMNEKVFVAGTVTDEYGFEHYEDLSEAMIPVKKEGSDSCEWVSYTDYFNVEKAPKRAEDELPEEEYNPEKIYMNQGHSIVAIPVELLEAIGKPKYFSFRLSKEKMQLIIKAEEEMTPDYFDIPERVYNGKWKGIRVLGGDFGAMILKLMGIRNGDIRLETIP
ncbi:helix-turn-helix domain-containing protein [Butyrivibrio sp. INlla16]|uniref:helix-turn-helix domain-containing protein n=1 Tax=Butyrivibrio sp. INlla16 TaxID=1520807 RepID=UPI00088A6FE0|nr:helix-turn-helix transcriptional regulator [Butyrivibrio sp. INlla16]SDB52413.1 Transcriptional regulator, contains XRE-family HTH domain [Butyrivibrio sp. INlla16]